MKIYVRYFLIVLCLCVATSVHAEEICEIDRYNIIERVESRHYPSLLSQFGIGPWETAFSEAENREFYDLIFYDPGILLSYWRDTPDGMKLIANPGLENSKRRRERLLASRGYLSESSPMGGQSITGAIRSSKSNSRKRYPALRVV